MENTDTDHPTRWHNLSILPVDTSNNIPLFCKPLWKHAYSKILNFTTKIWKFSDKNSDFFFSYFCSKHRLRVLVWTACIPCKPLFNYIKEGFKGVKLIQACFRDGEVKALCRLQVSVGRSEHLLSTFPKETHFRWAYFVWKTLIMITVITYIF